MKNKKMYITSFIILLVVMFISICSLTFIRTTNKYKANVKSEYKQNNSTLGFGTNKTFLNNTLKMVGEEPTITAYGTTVSHTGWYYEDAPVYESDAVVNNDYPKNDFLSDYSKGAIYWVVKLEGNIEASDSSYNGFYLRFTPNGTTMKRDSVVGVYEAQNNIDFNEFESYQDFVDSDLSIKVLSGNPQNDKYFGDTAVPNPDYSWYAETAQIDGIIFPKGYNINENKAIYIIIRTIPSTKLTNNRLYKEYKSTISIGYNKSLTGDTITADYIYDGEGPLYNESKGAFTYDAENQEFVSYSTHDYDSDDFDMKAHLSDIFTSEGLDLPSGTYAAWLVNVNWNGYLFDDVIVSDYLPEGIEFVAADVYYIGRGAKSNPPTTMEIDGLEDWEKSEITNDSGKVISYYDSTDRIIRWKVSNLRQNSSEYSEFNIRVICKVTDTKALLDNTFNSITTTAVIEDVATSDGTFAINRLGVLNKYLDTDSLMGTFDGTNIESKDNTIPFKIEINKFEEDLTKLSSLQDKSILPSFVDELSEGFELIKDSLKITDSDGNIIEGYTLKLEKTDDKQKIIIEGLPNKRHLIISYDVRSTEKPIVTLDVTNTSYWDGYTEPELPQVRDVTFTYIPDIIDISIEQVFEDLNGNIVQMTSGNYYFGLFDSDDELLETLMIAYDGDNIEYYIDGEKVENPVFSVYDLDRPYKIYELDDNTDIIKNNNVAMINNNNYTVTYDIDNNSIKGNTSLKVINKENPVMDNIPNVPFTIDNVIINISLMLLGLFGLLGISVYKKIFN